MKSTMADQLLDKKPRLQKYGEYEPVVVLQVMLCGEQELLAEVMWKEDFDKVGYIYIGVGDEPEGCTSRVYKDKHREFVGLDENYKLIVKGVATDFDWEKDLHEKN